MSKQLKIRIATRGSDLALSQAYYIERRLKDLPDPPKTEIIIIKTSGDRIQNVPLSQIAGDTPDDRKGFFTKEIEDALLANEADIAVHSFKDLPTIDISGLAIMAVPQRLNPFDVILFPREKRVMDAPPYLAPGSKVGTSSVRRISQIEHRWPGLSTTDLRGNVPTRIQKILAAGKNADENANRYDAILLSGAGYERLQSDGSFQRLGLDQMIADELEVITLPPEEFVPAPAQGTLAVQCRENDEKTIDVLKQIHDAELFQAVAIERAVLKAVEGGCHLPLGCYAEKNRDGGYRVHLYLGREAVDNRNNKSYYKVRYYNDPRILTDRVIKEIKGKLPLVLTGLDERAEELQEKYGKERIVALPLISTETLELSGENKVWIHNWIKESRNRDRRSVIAIFSATGVKVLSRWLSAIDIQDDPIHFAVTGEKTSEAIQRYFPGMPVSYRSEDGTGESLASVLRKNHTEIHTEIPAFTAMDGRSEFFDSMNQNGFQTHRIPLYETRPRKLDLGSILQIPGECYILFGSPSAVKNYAGQMQMLRPGWKELQGHRYCSIGPTTTSAFRELGMQVYAQATQPDYDLMIEELI